MVEKNKWIIAMGTVIVLSCVVGIVVMAFTIAACPGQTEIDVTPTLTNNSKKHEPSPLPSSPVEIKSFSIAEAETYKSDETRTKSSLNNNDKTANIQECEDAVKAINEIKSKIRKIFTTITPNSTDQEKDFQCKVTKLMLYIVSETNPNIESSIIKTPSSDIAMENVLETIMKSICQNTTWMLQFDKQVAGFVSSHIAEGSSNGKTKLVDLNIEKKINGIGFVNTKDVSSEINTKEKEYFLDFQTEATGVTNSHIRNLSTSKQPAPLSSDAYKNPSTDINREVTGIGFSTDSANTNSVPDLEREIAKVRSQRATAQSTSNESQSDFVMEQICIFGNYVVLAALIVVLISIIIFIIMHIHLGTQKYTITEPERGEGAMKT